MLRDKLTVIIKDWSQTDRVTVLANASPNPGPWLWLLTLTFDPRRAGLWPMHVQKIEGHGWAASIAGMKRNGPDRLQNRASYIYC